MRKSLQFLFQVVLLFNLGHSASAQLLSVGAESELTILGGTDFSIDQLVLVPSKDYSIRNNSLSATKNNLFALGKSVSKTYFFDQNPLPFHGKVLMGVAESELNPAVSIQLYDNMRWNTVETKPSLFNRQLLEGNIVTGRVTKAITVGQSDSKGDFEIVTNPAVNKILTLEIYKAGEYQFVSLDGKILMNQKFSEGLHRVNLSRYVHATYMITNRNSTKTFIL
jgi:hypothetical protein